MSDISVSSQTGQVPSQPSKLNEPISWLHGGLVLPRTQEGTGSRVVGDPCIIWDETIPGWRMVLFCSPPGHAQAICRSVEDVGPGQWEFQGPMVFTNPDALHEGRMHKPYIVQEADRPGHAAKIDGRYMLLGVTWKPDGCKQIQRAWAAQLAGPWTWEKEPLIPTGHTGDFDEKHTDAVTGLYFADRHECVYFYMGYPRAAQARKWSPFGNAQGVAVEQIGKGCAHKLGIILAPEQQQNHWASGWVGGLQVLPGKTHRWIAVANASPTAPRPDQDRHISREEPPPSLGGFAYCDEEYPTRGWRWAAEPIEWIEQIPAEALAHGEGTNLWRHYLLQLPSGRVALFYNSGSYGREQLYAKWGASE